MFGMKRRKALPGRPHSRYFRLARLGSGKAMTAGISRSLVPVLTEAQRALGRVLERQGIVANPLEVAGLALHTAVVAIRRAEGLPDSARISLAQEVLAQCRAPDKRQ